MTAFTSAPHNEVSVEVGSHYTGVPAVRIVFGSPESTHTTAEVVTDAGTLRQLGLELIQAANALDPS